MAVVAEDVVAARVVNDACVLLGELRTRAGAQSEDAQHDLVGEVFLQMSGERSVGGLGCVARARGQRRQDACADGRERNQQADAQERQAPFGPDQHPHGDHHPAGGSGDVAK